MMTKRFSSFSTMDSTCSGSGSASCCAYSCTILPTDTVLAVSVFVIVRIVLVSISRIFGSLILLRALLLPDTGIRPFPSAA